MGVKGATQTMAAITPIDNAITTNTDITKQAAKLAAGATSFDDALNNAIGGSKSVTLDSIFEKASETYGIDANLLKAVAKVESNFTADATSKSGAMGIMQLMPSTAKSLGVTDAYDPEQNIMGGAKLLASHLKKYNGDISLALAAYNCGSNVVDKYGGVPPYKETQNYIKKVTQYYNGTIDVPDTAYSTGTKTAAGTTAEAVNVDTRTPEEKALDKHLATVPDMSVHLTSNLETETVEESVAATDSGTSTTQTTTSTTSSLSDDYSYDDYLDYVNDYLNLVTGTSSSSSDSDSDSLSSVLSGYYSNSLSKSSYSSSLLNLLKSQLESTT
jgi:hypothetical protein